MIPYLIVPHKFGGTFDQSNENAGLTFEKVLELGKGKRLSANYFQSDDW